MSTNVKPVATINGKKYPLIFGFKFLNEINALKPDVEEVDEFVQLIGGLQDGDAFAFRKLMHAALITYDDLTTKEIDEYLETSDEVLTLFENFITFLKHAPLTALRTKKALEAIKKIMAYVEQMEQMEVNQQETTD
ncbi:hypothetical protein IDE00_000652 [Enterococcus faecalis]|uniref:tail assembly chaperone n=1 Tax=Enterococcus faecalis TaxID=1351 RepID=UPI0018E76FFC|nr:tail assembly chaperone [Enterococcus faecalis]EGO2799398.1 hypothetical protein [Enterococcus faecalis]EJB2751339.1 hypothetical protein [Enterococcus faecalis]MBJ1675916.1 hypothetical protein [Enterococcus faecalis]MBJ1776249.1 hypothetical protein [Enterococcus faecalis]MCU9781316.1 tail assembly chaperone [Enterococcus faecalis]